MRILLRVLVGLALLLLLALGAAWLVSRERVGGTPGGARLERMRHSQQWRDGAFDNPLARIDGSFGEMLSQALFGGSDQRTPARPIETLARTRADYAEPPASGLRVTWLGHSTLLVELDGARLLLDPVWGERASPFTSLGPKRFYAPPLPLSDLPPVDAIVISHDHYDHLDYDTVVQLRARATTWVVPLGVGAHLERWGVATTNIVELDWWEDTRVGPITLTCTPSRHFSGRSVLFADQNATLWAGWALRGPTHRVFYSGDTALHPAFAEIGERLGPFDVGMFEVGAYNALWSDVHLGPEQAVIAHGLVQAHLFVPVHWGLFDLAAHSWTEPIERTIAAARKAHVAIATPRPGGSVEFGADGPPRERWWPELPWQSVEQAPCWSSSVDDLLQGAP